ncbi:MAG: decaprenyl-phosphate phosphoribosyltransferase [Deltaproteobacteria bacterium]|nr:MAG: decaprenyl-phosphate phosphoribosyltransferase [Deltaproteobacteria bacterium]
MWAGLLKAMRPHQWVKNIFVLAPLVFARDLFEADRALPAGLALGLFCLASSTVYLLNDLTDVEADRAHPVKRNRPIASGQLSLGAARNAAILLAAISVGFGYWLSPQVAGAIGGDLVLNFFYSKSWKHIAYIDVLCITTGFELRVLAGAYAADVPASAYVLIATFLLASFLGFGKRMHELMQGKGAEKQRSVLANYSERTLTFLLYGTAVAAVATYVGYTLDPSTREAFGTDFLVVTSVMPAFGVLRFLHLVRRRNTAESPTEDMLRDKLFLTNGLAYLVAVVVIIYFG